MNILKLFSKIFLVILICLFSRISFAGFENGVKAYQDGNYEKALKIWIVLAEDGLSEAQLNIGLFYHNGIGVNIDYKEAFKWLLMSSEQGEIDAIRTLSTMYALGNGVKKDYLKSYMWAKIGADNDDQNSKILLDELVKEMQGSEINKANEMVQICNNKNFKGC